LLPRGLNDLFSRSSESTATSSAVEAALPKVFSVVPLEYEDVEVAWGS